MPKRLLPPSRALRGPSPDRAAPPVSPLVLCDHLIQVAQEADRAGYPGTAASLVALVDRMFDAPAQRH